MATKLALLGGRFALGASLGPSGQAKVHRALDQRSGLAVVVKLVSAPDAAARARLLAEFERLASLDHPALPAVLEIGELDGDDRGHGVFIALELLSGDDAKQACARLRGEALVACVARVLSDAAAALDALHERGLVHHDVKPAHLILGEDGHARLIDLGLVRAAGASDGTVRGTLAYLAPEALAGAADPGVDLFALGVSAYELLAGELPYPADSPSALLEAQARPRRALRAPAALCALVDALLEVDPAARPSRASLVVDELTRAGLASPRSPAASPTRGLRRASYVASPDGRGASLLAVERALGHAGLVLLVGPAGSGRSRLVVELDRRRALDALRAGGPRPRLLGPTLGDAARELGLELGGELATRCGQLVDRLLVENALLHLEAPEPSEVVALWRALEARDDRRGPARLLVEVDAARADELASRLISGEGVARVELAALTQEEMATLCERLLGRTTPELRALAVRLGRGSPRLLLDLLRAAEARAKARSGQLEVADLRAVRVDALEEELARVVTRLRPGGQALLAALALLQRPVAPDELAAIVPASSIAAELAALEREHLVAWRATAVLLESQLVGTAALSALSSAQHQALGATLLATADEQGALVDAARLARRLGRADAPRRAAQALDLLLTGATPKDGAPPLEETLELAKLVGDARGAWLGGALLFAAAEYPRALVALAEALRVRPALPADVGADCELLRARALRATGARGEARKLAMKLAASGGAPAGAAQVLVARLLLDAGESRPALAALGEIEIAPLDPWGRGEYQEVRGLAALHEGQMGLAREAFVELGRLLERAPPARLARSEALLGMLAQAEGDLEEAAAAYLRALEAAEAGAELHGAAIYAQNLGGVLRELGEHARALPVLERASEVLGRLGRADELALALFNLGGVHLALGDLDAASATARRVASSESASARRHADLLAAEVERRRGELPAALVRYEGLLADGRASLEPSCDVLVLSGRVEVLAALDPARARIALHELVLAVASATPALARHARLAEARVRFTLDPDTGLPAGLLSALRESAEAAERGGQRELALRARILLLRDALRRADRADVTIQLDLARLHHEEIRMRTPELRRAALADDPDVARLVALVEASERAPGDPGPIRRLIEINKRLNSELDLERLLELILDTVIELSRAERGFLLLRADDGALEIRLERNVEASARAGARAFSHSIAERAVAEGEPIVTVDAADDRRFDAALSVVDLRLRSVLAVPLQVKGRVVGCVYVDHRARVALFRPAEVALVVDLAEQAAIAIENARLLADNRAKANQVRALNAALAEKLASQSIELEGMHREVREARRSLGVRHDYAGLIGQTPRMLELFRLLDRVTETALPVVIYGESGTGKELVARAIHHNGPRRKAAFVSESCAAIPETLLEAALFGHVRGAFTGAQGERRGLFEIADGGTLFLDEVGEMSPGMQVRLLRVLQEGEFRRVGGEKLLKADVRVLVASNRDLGRLVEEGAFREDLFYRLNVVRVGLPALRERPADIPLLVEHFLAQRPTSRGITRRALERLSAYAWPGNVRQLENEIARASSMADGPIDLADLSPQVQAGTEAAGLDGPEPLDLHARVERLERGLLTEALSRAGGNQSEAARLLGLSRFGLQKKLQRYRMRPTAAAKSKAR